MEYRILGKTGHEVSTVRDETLVLCRAISCLTANGGINYVE